MSQPHLCFWQPVLTDHAIFTYKALADHLDMEVLCISDREELGVRKQQGWTAASDVLPIKLLPDDGWQGWVDQLIGRHCGDIHIIGSPFERSRINLALRLATQRRKQVYLLSEPYAPLAISYFGGDVTLRDRIKACLRPAMYRWHGLRYASRLTGVFAISPLAVRQYATMGVPAHRIFPFGYFVPSAQAETSVVKRVDKEMGLRVAFVGSLIPRKGLATAIEAMRRITRPVSLDIFGPGEHSVLGQLPTNVRYCGKIPFGQTQSALTTYDVLLVPSLHDGWAVVVNEAVQAGLAIIVSEETGASTMIERWQCGARFPAGDAVSLAMQLDRFAGDGQLLSKARNQARMLAPLLDPTEAGRYMADCIRAAQTDTPPPSCPWY